MQYRESDLGFVQRLLEEEGIYYYFRHEEAKHTMVLADSIGGHETAEGYETVPYTPEERQAAGAEEHFWGMRVRKALYPGRQAVLSGYDPSEVRPGQLRFGETSSEEPAPGSQFEYYDYPGGLPWGASIRRAENGEVEFDDGSGWKPATGNGAPMNKAVIRYYILSKDPMPSPDGIRKKARAAFDIAPDEPTGQLVKVWERNDFGKWAFNLRRGGRRTPYYIHTTPEDEYATAHGLAFSLAQSHGCIHIRPADRDTMIREGYLAAGIRIEVKGYKEKGPP